MSKKVETTENARKSIQKSEHEPETKGRFVSVLLLVLSILASLVFYFLR